MQERRTVRLGFDGRRLVVPTLASATVILSSPVIGEARAAIRAAFLSEFQSLIAAGLAAAVAVVLIVAARSIQNRRAIRFGVLTIAIVGAVLYARGVATGNAEVDAVEHVHFVEYGMIAWLFYRAVRPLDNGFVLVWPLLAAVLVGILDEFVQWFVPGRVGEAHDVFLNGMAAACGLCFGAAIDPPQRLAVPLDRGATRPVAYGVSLVLIAFAFFVQEVHLGYGIYEPDIGMFWSHYAAADLLTMSADRERRWRTEPPAVLRPFAREDQYLSEGLWHVQARNLAWTADDPFTAWRENLILERFFSPVLDTPSYASSVPPRWPVQQRADTAVRVAGDPGIYISRAAPFPIYTWSPIALWSVVALIVAGLVTAC